MKITGRHGNLQHLEPDALASCGIEAASLLTEPDDGGRFSREKTAPLAQMSSATRRCPLDSPPWPTDSPACEPPTSRASLRTCRCASSLVLSRARGARGVGGVIDLVLALFKLHFQGVRLYPPEQ